MMIRIDKEQIAQTAAARRKAASDTHASTSTTETTKFAAQLLGKERSGGIRNQLPGRSPSNAPTPFSTNKSQNNLSMLHAQRLAHWSPVIKYCAAKYGVPIDLICGIMLQESGGNPKAKSYCGATGLMQLMPATARRFGVTDIWNPGQNIEGGVRYLRYLLDHYRGNPTKVIAAYNSGEGNVDKHGGIPPFAETQHYVPSVMQFAHSVANILRGGPMPMRAMIRATLPAHSIANFTSATHTQRPTPETTTTLAARMARL